MIRDKTRRMQIAGGKTPANVLFLRRAILMLVVEGHPDVCMESMLGGKTRRVVMDWLQK